MNPQFEDTAPHYFLGTPDGPEYVRSHTEWCTLCAQRLRALLPTISPEEAFDLAHEWSLDDNLRACAPERVAEDRFEDAEMLEA